LVSFSDLLITDRSIIEQNLINRTSRLFW